MPPARSPPQRRVHRRRSPLADVPLRHRQPRRNGHRASTPIPPPYPTPGAATESAHYDDEALRASVFTATSETTLPGHAVHLDLAEHTLSDVRQLVANHATRLGVTARAVDNLVLIVSELATNAIFYGSDGVLSLWRQDAHVICQTRNRGAIVDPLVGRLPPPIDQPNGRGLDPLVSD